ncbi:MAG: glutamate racemase [Gammaproteobacteria bacterium RIFOXYA12_FULL_61_12]|nr:MAG: glutamate racemase [Gammaproteobacteria bacterium RIFOXYD12_FULL_61_37]OGT92022.1 MAG: glutamate racemase [Gammaproteobacteria bacterium RIFOXYA12_FULL_61_12]
MHKPLPAEATSQQPIGVFDSGVGGLSVLAHIRRRLPRERLIYAADSAHVPYGDKPTAEIRRRSLAVAESLLGLGAKALVVACNTATAVAIHDLRNHYPHLPIVGMEPGVKPAVAQSRARKVGVLATTGTLRSGRFSHLLERHGGGAEVIMQPCPGLVERVERGELSDGITEALLKRYLEPLLENGVDSLVLGCTHYPFLIPLIERLAGPGVTVIDTGPAVARQVEQRLSGQDLLNGHQAGGGIRFFTSGELDRHRSMFERLWGESLLLESLPEVD